MPADGSDEVVNAGRSPVIFQSHEPVESVQESVAPAVISTAQTIQRRHLAASFDFMMVLVLIFICAKAIGDKHPIWQAVVVVAVALGYYFFFEGAVSRTPGKLLAGLKVVGKQGHPCTWRQSFIRTAFRLVEVNPIFIGGLPAALCIVFSRHNQRIGDKAARTIVVRTHRVRHLRTTSDQPPS
jgi:uncharacterized RDD family membrane protein YckC